MDGRNHGSAIRSSQRPCETSVSMNDLRSQRCVFVSHCLLAQGIMAQGVVKKYPSLVRPIVQFCLDNEVNIFQMPCPESQCPAGGLVRNPHGKQWYENRGLRIIAREIAQGQVSYMAKLIEEGFEVLAVIGVDFSPACGVNYLNQGYRIYADQGIYVEELKKCLRARKIECAFVGVNQRWEKKLSRDLQNLLS